MFKMLNLHKGFYVCLVQKNSLQQTSTQFCHNSPHLPSILINFSDTNILIMAKRGAKAAPDTAEGGDVALEPKSKCVRKPRATRGKAVAGAAATPKTAAAVAEASTVVMESNTTGQVTVTTMANVSTLADIQPAASVATAVTAGGAMTTTAAANAANKKTPSSNKLPPLQSPACGWNIKGSYRFTTFQVMTCEVNG